MFIVTDLVSLTIVYDNTCADPEGWGQGVRPLPLKNYKAIEFLSRNGDYDQEYWSEFPDMSLSYQASIHS